VRFEIPPAKIPVQIDLLCSLDLNDLIELRKLRKARQGIDAAKLNKGDARKKKKRPREEEEAEQGGLRKGAAIPEDEE
jgi:hypothetical protein